MKCESVLPLLYDYTLSELPPKKMQAVLRHLKECRLCREELVRYRGIKSLFKAEMKEPPADILKNIKKELKQESLWDRLFSPKPAIGFTFALFLAVSILLVNKNIEQKKEAQISEFLYNSYYITSAEEDTTDYMTLTDISEL